MKDDRDPTTVEYQGNDVSVFSTDPLTGTLELVSDQEEIILVELDRASAENLLSALLQFLNKGEGDDAPTIISSTIQ
ncbi:hypothetical protein [Ensifer sp. BR816]|uniref:hypothetical protein n=1 Tax=Rhizobium sp. (strain BR816) TaxID=1057002 RepID=UPI0003731838|nr:hypothetical protein [Ensifer sp. BR816]